MAKNFQDGFEVWLNYPHELVFDNAGTPVKAYVEMEVKLFCEPDESVGNTDWWVSQVHLRASEKFGSQLSKLKEISLPKNDPLTMRIIKWAVDDESNHINECWSDWLNDNRIDRIA